MIKNIEIKKLHPHSRNPRKDLGDLTELAASIKENGVMQNLTVVPEMSGYCPSCTLFIPGIARCKEDHDKNHRPPCPKWDSKGTYTVVIGHRRLAAARLAGLEELPCSIVEMSERQQVATMLLENMQRADLTVYEQANGFQMMLDLGDTITTIAQQTGFSETTVRNRVKLMELDMDKFKASQERGGTLMDYIHLSEISDLKKRNAVLETVGTNDFQYKLRGAIIEQKEKQNRPMIKKELESFATLIEDKNTHKYEYVSRIDLCNYEPGKLIPKDSGKKKYFFTWTDKNSYNTALYKEGYKEKSIRRSQAEIDLEKAVHDAEAMLKDLTALAYETRFEFVKSVSIKKSQLPDILEFICKATLYQGVHYRTFSGTSFREALNIDGSQYTPEIQNKYFNAYDENPLRVSVLSAWAILGDSNDTGYYQKNYGRSLPQYKENACLDLIYKFLKCLGYEMSSEEIALADGTHDIFPQKAEGVEEKRSCRVCGCTEDNACQGGCYWVEQDLCSQCATEQE
ncbi:MAG: ParB/RepB/Spo0J family partition protein [Eubacteriales bacterium]